MNSSVVATPENFQRTWRTMQPSRIKSTVAPIYEPWPEDNYLIQASRRAGISFCFFRNMIRVYLSTRKLLMEEAAQMSLIVIECESSKSCMDTLPQGDERRGRAHVQKRGGRKKEGMEEGNKSKRELVLTTRLQERTWKTTWSCTRNSLTQALDRIRFHMTAGTFQTSAIIFLCQSSGNNVQSGGVRHEAWLNL